MMMMSASEMLHIVVLMTRRDEDETVHRAPLSRWSGDWSHRTTRVRVGTIWRCLRRSESRWKRLLYTICRKTRGILNPTD